ncbi:MAG: hypothetical protein LBQ66_01340 [Planctomycetaceae bacterium]|jgi:hypothetical protein|nr:hypothetical protein [Planctomycetaceae bacterium]
MQKEQIFLGGLLCVFGCWKLLVSKGGTPGFRKKARQSLAYLYTKNITKIMVQIKWCKVL